MPTETRSNENIVEYRVLVYHSPHQLFAFPQDTLELISKSISYHGMNHAFFLSVEVKTGNHNFSWTQ